MDLDYYYKTKNNSRDLAKFSDAMPFKHLIHAAALLLSKKGLFSVVIPQKEEQQFINLASKVNLFPKRILHIRGNTKTEIKRSLIEFSLVNSKVSVEELILENSRHHYTEKYKNLVKDFYLKL